MQLGFVTAIFGDLSFEEVLKHASEIGYDCVEVMCWPPGVADREYGGVTHLDCTDFTQTMADDARALCEKYGVKMSALGYYPNLLDPDPAVADVARAQLERVIVAAPLLGLATVNTFVGRDGHRPEAVVHRGHGEGADLEPVEARRLPPRGGPGCRRCTPRANR